MTYIAGSPGDFLAVRHLTLRGTQAEIGYALGEEVAARSAWTPPPLDPLVARARRTWFTRNWPQHQGRTEGMATAFGLTPDAAVALDGASGLPPGSGCSAVWAPPGTAADGRGRLGRNYDFFTTSFAQLGTILHGGEPVDDGTAPMASRPYVLTTLPDEGLASTVLTMSTVDSAMEGVNEAGLAVALLMDDVDKVTAPTSEFLPQAGLSTTQLPRFLLDTCENAEQAKEALMTAKLYDQGMPLHYIVADASGHGFVFERDTDDVEYFVEVADGPLCVTNHSLHRHDVENLPEDTPESMDTYQRARTLAKETAGTSSPGHLRAALDSVAVEAEPGSPWRTLWRSVFDLDARTMATRFYLGDGADGVARYTGELVFEASR